MVERAGLTGRGFLTGLVGAAITGMAGGSPIAERSGQSTGSSDTATDVVVVGAGSCRALRSATGKTCGPHSKGA